MRKMSSRQARRLMNQLGMQVDEIQDTRQVIIKTPTKEIVIDNPEVSVTRMQGQDIYQVMGGSVTERAVQGGENAQPLVIPEEDVRLVAQQAGVTVDAARRALEAAEGDLAQAILSLTQTR
jgi:nascent polypeptide-associated complex subunit alpha